MTKYNYQKITVAGDAGDVVASGINDQGQVVGWSIPGGYNFYPHSFVDTNGSMTPLSGVSPIPVTAWGMNNHGHVSGTVGSAPVGIRGFLWKPDAPTQTITGSPSQTNGPIDQAFGVNDNDEVVGIDYLHGNSGFLWKDGQMSFIQYPGSATTELHGISDTGIMVGAEGGPRKPDGSPSPDVAFSDDHGTMTAIIVPGATQSTANAISPDGKEIVGTYQDAAGHEHGFTDRGGHIQTLDVPGATGTRLYGVNDFQQVVGSYFVAGDPNQHGFVATPSTTKMTAHQAISGAIRQQAGASTGTVFYDHSQPMIPGIVAS